LCLHAVALDSGYALAYNNAAVRQLDQGKVKEAEATLARMRHRFPDNADGRRDFLSVLYAAGRIDDAERYADSVRAAGDVALRAEFALWKADLARLRGRYVEAQRLDGEARAGYAAQRLARVSLSDSLNTLYMDAWFHGPSERLVRALDVTLTALPLSGVAAPDRQYFRAAAAYALAGRPDRARAVLEQREREVTDTALLRVQGPGLHTALAEIALAEHKPQVALSEFRRGDIDPTDGPHATACGGVCLAFNLGR